MALSTKMIIQEYKKIIETEHGNISIVRTIASRLGYKLDENNDSPFVRKVLKKYKSN